MSQPVFRAKPIPGAKIKISPVLVVEDQRFYTSISTYNEHGEVVDSCLVPAYSTHSGKTGTWAHDVASVRYTVLGLARVNGCDVEDMGRVVIPTLETGIEG